MDSSRQAMACKLHSTGVSRAGSARMMIFGSAVHGRIIRRQADIPGHHKNRGC